MAEARADRLARLAELDGEAGHARDDERVAIEDLDRAVGDGEIARLGGGKPLGQLGLQLAVCDGRKQPLVEHHRAVGIMGHDLRCIPRAIAFLGRLDDLLGLLVGDRRKLGLLRSLLLAGGERHGGDDRDGNDRDGDTHD